MLSLKIMALALALRESEGKPDAVSGDCVGILQMKPIMVDEVNRIVGYNKYHYEDRLNPKLSLEMCELKLDFSLPRQWTIKDACLLWREGDAGRYRHTEEHKKYVFEVTKYYWKVRNKLIDVSFKDRSS